jgi:hypothetical protein
VRKIVDISNVYQKYVKDIVLLMFFRVYFYRNCSTEFIHVCLSVWAIFFSLSSSNLRFWDRSDLLEIKKYAQTTRSGGWSCFIFKEIHFIFRAHHKYFDQTMSVNLLLILRWRLCYTLWKSLKTSNLHINSQIKSQKPL